MDLNDIRTALILGGNRGYGDGRAEAWSDGQCCWIEGGGQPGQASSRSMKESERASTLGFKGQPPSWNSFVTSRLDC